MAEEKDPEGQSDWQELKQRFLRMLHDLKEAILHLLLPSFMRPAAPRSIEQIAEEFSSQIDSFILKNERSKNLKFVAGKFRIVWGGQEFSTVLELYYQTSEGKWIEQTRKTAMPVESLTEESRKELELKEEVTYPIEPPSAM